MLLFWRISLVLGIHVETLNRLLRFLQPPFYRSSIVEVEVVTASSGDSGSGVVRVIPAGALIPGPAGYQVVVV